MNQYVNHIYVVSKGKPQTVSIVAWFARWKFKAFTIVVSASDNVGDYKMAYGCNVVRVPKTLEDTLPAKRQWIIRETTKTGGFLSRWVFMMDDNVVKVTGQLDNKPLTRAGADKELSPQQLLKVVNADIELCEKHGIIHGGFASNSNYFFRKRKYRFVGFVWGKMGYYKNVGLDWYPLKHKDDYGITALALLYSGKVLINNFLYSHAKRYEAIGGDGPYEKRVPFEQEAARTLVESFKGLYRYAERPGCAPKSEVRMRFTSVKQIAEWRKQF